MSEEMKADIAKAIEQHLPAQVGNVLKERLATVEQLEKDLSQARYERDDTMRKSIELSKTLGKHGELGAREDAVAKRESEVAKRELACQVAEIKVQAAERAKQDIYQLAEIVFRSPRHVRTVSESGQVPAPSGHYQVGTSNFRTETEGE